MRSLDLASAPLASASTWIHSLREGRRLAGAAVTVATLVALAFPRLAAADLPPPQTGTAAASLEAVRSVDGQSLVELGRVKVPGFGTLTLWGEPPEDCASSPYLLALSGERVSYVEVGRCRFTPGRDQSYRATLELKRASAVTRGARKYLWVEFVKRTATQDAPQPDWKDHPEFLQGWVFDVTEDGTLRRLVESIPVIAYVNRSGKPAQIDVDFDGRGNVVIKKRTRYVDELQAPWLGTTRIDAP